jgi:hypothetical protein
MVDYPTEYYKGLIGYQVVGYEYKDGFPTLIMENMRKNDNPKTISVAVSKDPEGNGEGFLFITETSGDVSF